MGLFGLNKKNGYIKSTFKIDGMHCSHCKATVEEITKKIPGITWAEVDLKEGVLRYEEAQSIDLEALKTAIRSEGFGV